MSVPTTPAEQLAEADALDAQAAHLEEQARLARAAAKLYRAMAGLREAGLTGTYPKGTLGTEHMEAQSPSAGANISAAKTKSRWPLQQALIKRNLSLPMWARAQRKPHQIEVETAKSWLKAKGKGGRKIPREWADRIAAEFVDEKKRSEVPAVAASWPNGIREDSDE